MFDLTVDAMADDIFPNQVCPDDTTYDFYPDEAMTFDLATNTMADESLGAISNQVWLDSITWDSYFDGRMTLNSVVDNTMANETSGIRNNFCPCDSYFDEPMTLNTVADHTFHIHDQADPEVIACNSYGDEPVTLNLAASATTDDTFDTHNPTFPEYMTSDSHLDRPTTKEFRKWKDSWDEKILLVRWKREGKDWEKITKSFQKMGIQRRSGGWKSMLQRADAEIEALGKAAVADREGEADRLRDLALHHALGDAARVDYDDLWARISESMKMYGSEMKWSSDKVKYAWNHGVASLFPHIQLRQRKLFKATLM